MTNLNLAFSFLASVCLSRCACNTSNRPEQPSWLTGQWKYEALTPPALETWISGSQDTLIGNGSVVIENDTIQIEFMKIYRDDKGLTLAFRSCESPEYYLKATACTADSVVFENPELDFPSKMTYLKTGNHNRETILSGKLNGRDTTLRFSLQL